MRRRIPNGWRTPESPQAWQRWLEPDPSHPGERPLRYQVLEARPTHQEGPVAEDGITEVVIAADLTLAHALQLATAPMLRELAKRTHATHPHATEDDTIHHLTRLLDEHTHLDRPTEDSQP